MRAFSTFHVYVHLALFFERVEQMETASAGALEATPAAFRGSIKPPLYFCYDR